MASYRVKVGPGVSTPIVRVSRCSGLLARARGLIGRPPPRPGCGLLLAPCRRVHSFFMSYAIDVVGLDGEGTVTRVERLPPWRVGGRARRTRAVLELRAGEASRLGLVIGAHPTLIVIGADATQERLTPRASGSPGGAG